MILTKKELFTEFGLNENSFNDFEFNEKKRVLFEMECRVHYLSAILRYMQKNVNEYDFTMVMQIMNELREIELYCNELNEDLYCIDY